MSIISPEIEFVDRSEESIRFLEHGWPTDLCRWHAHAEYELHFVLETSGRAFVGDYIGDFGPESLFLTGPHLPHNWVTDASDTTSVPTRDMLVQFSDESMTSLFGAFSEFQSLRPLLELSRSGIEFKGIKDLDCRQWFERIRDASGSDRILVFLSFLALLNEKAEKNVLSVVKITQANTNKRQLQIGEAVDYIVTKFDEDLSVKVVAQAVGLSETSFTRHFREVTGNRFTEFVNRVRVGEACRLLIETDDQVSSVCYAVGFQNLANFNRHFLKMKGATPTVYRDQARGRLSEPVTFQSLSRMPGELPGPTGDNR